MSSKAFDNIGLVVHINANFFDTFCMDSSFGQVIVNVLYVGFKLGYEW